LASESAPDADQWFKNGVLRDGVLRTKCLKHLRTNEPKAGRSTTTGGGTLKQVRPTADVGPPTSRPLRPKPPAGGYSARKNGQADGPVAACCLADASAVNRVRTFTAKCANQRCGKATPQARAPFSSHSNITDTAL